MECKFIFTYNISCIDWHYVPRNLSKKHVQLLRALIKTDWADGVCSCVSKATGFLFSASVILAFAKGKSHGPCGKETHGLAKEEGAQSGFLIVAGAFALSSGAVAVVSLLVTSARVLGLLNQ